MAGGLGTWQEVAEMPLYVIRLGLVACDRRDASIAMHQLDCVHAAIAPIMVGEDGMSAYNKCFKRLSEIIRPSKIEGRKKDGLFKRMITALKPK